MLATALLALTACVAPVDDDKSVDPDSPHVVVSAALDRTAIAPGETAWLGVSFDIDEHWHLYWPGLNDSGMSIALDATLPDGLTLGEWRWPAPTRHVSPGDLLDHVYEGRVTLVAPLHVDEGLAVGTHTVSVKHDWLVCREACMFGGGTASLEVTVAAVGDGATRAPSAAADWFAASRARWPKPWGAAEHRDVVTPLYDAPIKPETREHGGTLVWVGKTLTIEMPNATQLVFHAHESSANIEGLLHHGTTEGPVLELTFEDEGARAVGVLEVHRDQGSAAFYEIDTRSS